MSGRIVGALFALTFSSTALAFGVDAASAKPKDQVGVMGAVPPPPQLLEPKLLPALDYRTAGGVSPSVELYGDGSGYFHNSEHLYWLYTVGVNFNSGLKTSEADKMSDEFNVQGGDGKFSLKGAVAYQFNPNIEIRGGVSLGYAWVSAEERTNTSGLADVKSQITQTSGSVGLWLGYFYLGYERTRNKVNGARDSEFERMIDNGTFTKYRLIVRLPGDYYLQAENAGDAAQIGFTKKMAVF